MMDYSDHHHVLLNLADKEFRKIPRTFEFECVWLVEDTFDHMLKIAWDTNHSLLRNLEPLKVTAM